MQHHVGDTKVLEKELKASPKLLAIQKLYKVKKYLCTHTHTCTHTHVHVHIPYTHVHIHTQMQHSHELFCVCAIYTFVAVFSNHLV